MMDALRQRLKQFVDDERAVSPVVGFVLIFALIMIVFTLYQSSVVPAQNEEVEFKHSQTVEGQMSKLSGAIQSASADGASRSQTVAIGMNYPTRALAINPGSPAGTLQTSEPHPIDITGVNIKGSKYWDGSNDFKTRSLSYTIDYNMLQNSPKFTIANGVVSKSYDTGTLAVGDSTAVLPGDQRQIDLTLLGGDYQKNGLTANPTVEPISTSTQYLHFTANSNSQIGLDSSLTTDQCVAKWVGVGGKNDDNDNTVEFPSSDANCNTHSLELDDGTDYALRISKIGFGDTSGLSDAADAHEVVPTELDKITGPGTATLDATPGEKTSFTVLVRDKYGNPVSNADLTATGGSSVDGSNIQQKKRTTNENGKATFTYTPASKGDKTIEVKIDGVSTSYNTATYEFVVTDSGSDGDVSGSDGGILGSGDITNGYGLESSIVTIDSATAQNNGPIKFQFNNRGKEPMRAVQVQMNGLVGNKKNPLQNGNINEEFIKVNERNVNLTDQPGVSDSNNTFTLRGGERQIEMDNITGNLNKAGLLLVTVQYQYYYKDGRKF